MMEDEGNDGADSPVSNNGRGLKQSGAGRRRELGKIRPLAITGVD